MISASSSESTADSQSLLWHMWPFWQLTKTKTKTWGTIEWFSDSVYYSWQIEKFRVKDGQPVSELDSICNSCDVFFFSHHFCFLVDFTLFQPMACHVQVRLAFDLGAAGGLHAFHLHHPCLACLPLLWQPGKVYGQLSGYQKLPILSQKINLCYYPVLINQLVTSGRAKKVGWWLWSWRRDWSKGVAWRTLWDLLW